MGCSKSKIEVIPINTEFSLEKSDEKSNEESTLFSVDSNGNKKYPIIFKNRRNGVIEYYELSKNNSFTSISTTKSNRTTPTSPLFL
jgi:hypothetical protein